jgi:hypothetical protein
MHSEILTVNMEKDLSLQMRMEPVDSLIAAM